MSWIERAKVGDCVVCVDSESNPGSIWRSGEELTEGAVYTIREIRVGGLTESVCFLLNELRRKCEYRTDHLFGYRATRFRPVHDTTTQVELLKRICLNTPEAVQ